MKITQQKKVEMKKQKIGILGATGAVGQQFIALLENHPWFEITLLAASESSAGKTFIEATKWLLESQMPTWLSEQVILSCVPNYDCDFVFSGLDSSVASEIEWNFAKNGIPVISNAKNYRTDPLVPLLIPEINPDHIHLIPEQQKKYNFGTGFIVTNPNCSSVGLTLSVYPLWQEIGIESMVVTTLQSISGAGYPGVASLEILGNIIPGIQGEADKIQTEPQKIFGIFKNNQISTAKLNISAQCNRVPVRNGHLISMLLKFERPVELEEIQSIYEDFISPLEKWNLPSAPKKPVQFTDSLFRPQPLLDVNLGNGMVVSVGQLQKCPVLDIRLTGLVHNTIRGAAGGAILNAECLKVNGYLKSRN